MWVKKKRINEINKGKICKADGCSNIAKAKGYCHHCYITAYKKAVDEGIK